MEKVEAIVAPKPVANSAVSFIHHSHLVNSELIHLALATTALREHGR
jgi:hypothetical protein